MRWLLCVKSEKSERAAPAELDMTNINPGVEMTFSNLEASPEFGMPGKQESEVHDIGIRDSELSGGSGEFKSVALLRPTVVSSIGEEEKAGDVQSVRMEEIRPVVADQTPRDF